MFLVKSCFAILVDSLGYSVMVLTDFMGERLLYKS